MAEVGSIRPLTPTPPLRREDQSHDGKGSSSKDNQGEDPSSTSSPLTVDQDKGEGHIDEYV